nr:outer membrane beta-barrel protein [Pseudoteredinibacter isoporae]
MGLVTAIAALNMAVAQADDSGFYGGVAIGSANGEYRVQGVEQELSDLGLTGSVKTRESDTAAKIFAGYQIVDNLAVELAYIDLGRLTADTTVTFPFPGEINTQTDVTGFNFSLIGGLNLSEAFRVNARVGIFSWETEFINQVNFPSSNARTARDYSGEDFSFGVGASYQLTDTLSVRLDWERLSAEDLESRDFDLTTVGLEMRF